MDLNFHMNTATALRALNGLRKYVDYLPYMDVSSAQSDALVTLLDQFEDCYRRFQVSKVPAVKQLDGAISQKFPRGNFSNGNETGATAPDFVLPLTKNIELSPISYNNIQDLFLYVSSSSDY